MNNEAFELGEEIRLKTLEFKLHQDLWDTFDIGDVEIGFDDWTTIKFLNETADGFSDQIGDLPNNSGGLYMFSIQCPILNGITNYPVYIGRAQFTDTQNLRKRCREYFTKYAREDERPLITKMFRYWGNELYLSFYELDNNIGIIDFEKTLINSLLLPFNTAIPDTEIKQAISAF